MSGPYTCLLCFLHLALLSPALSLACNASGGGGGFSLPIVSNHPAEIPGDVNLSNIRPRIEPVVYPIFSVVVGVGTGQHRHFYKLALDFVGSLTWLQCKPSNPEVPQQGLIYDSSVSRHFKYVPPTSTICSGPFVRHGHDKCSFDVTYLNGGARGFLGTDEFSFASSSGGGTTTVSDLIFGCSHGTRMFQNLNVYAGVMSLNQHPASFIYQLSQRHQTHWRFSYCLVTRSHTIAGSHSGYLRFGADVPDTSRAHSTALLYGKTTNLYYVSLAGISLDGRRLTRITPEMFRRDTDSYPSGTIVDLGTLLTKIVKPAYDILEAEVAAHLRRRGVAPGVQVGSRRFCVDAASFRLEHMPGMTLHFHEPGSKLDITKELLYMKVNHGQRTYMCLAVVPDAARTVIGAGQQPNTRFTFDIGRNKLYFAPEQCHQDA